MWIEYLILNIDAHAKSPFYIGFGVLRNYAIGFHDYNNWKSCHVRRFFETFNIRCLEGWQSIVIPIARVKWTVRVLVL